MKHACIGIALVLLLVIVPIIGQVNSPMYLNEKSELVVETIDGATATFKTVVVTESEDLARGLMHIRFLPLDQGMLFLYDSRSNVSMWMKDTPLSLDMWFVSESGLVTKVVKETIPKSTDLIRSDGAVIAVVEVNAGLSSLIGVTPGAQLRHTAFSNVENN